MIETERRETGTRRSAATRSRAPAVYGADNQKIGSIER